MNDLILDKTRNEVLSPEKKAQKPEIEKLLVTISWPQTNVDLDVAIIAKPKGQNLVGFEQADKDQYLFYGNRKTSFGGITPDNTTGADVNKEQVLTELGMSQEAINGVTKPLDEAVLVDLFALQAKYDAFYIVLSSYHAKTLDTLFRGKPEGVVARFYDGDYGVQINSLQDWTFNASSMKDAAAFVIAKGVFEAGDWKLTPTAAVIADSDNSGTMTVADATAAIIRKGL